MTLLSFFPGDSCHFIFDTGPFSCSLQNYSEQCALTYYFPTTELFFLTSIFSFLVSNFHLYFCHLLFSFLINLPTYLFLSLLFVYPSIHVSPFLASIVIELPSSTSHFQVSLKGRGAHCELGTLTLDLSGASELCNILC